MSPGWFYTWAVTSHTNFVARALVCGFAVATSVSAQTPPVNGLLPSAIRWDAIEHATVFTSPDHKIDDATILMRDGWIDAVGPSAQAVIPAGATIHDGRGKTVVAGFIEPALLVDSVAFARRASGESGAHWNVNVTPQVASRDLPPVSAAIRQELRELGFTLAAVYPDSGIFRGSGGVVLLGDSLGASQSIEESAGQFVAFGRGPRIARDRDWEEENQAPVYPNSVMGATALLRQTFLDARWRSASVAVWDAHPVGNDPPIAAAALDALALCVTGQERVLFDASTELDALRSGALAKEFGLDAAILGGGGEFRSLAEIAALKLPIIVPLDFPKAPSLTTARLAESASLGDLASWAAAPSNASRLIAAGVPVSLTTTRLERRTLFPTRVREARDAGLSESQLLAALTTVPAALLGVSDRVGTIAPGRLANLAVSTGALFAPESRIAEVWIAGQRYDTTATSDIPLASTFAAHGRHAITLLDGTACLLTIDSTKRTINFESTGANGAKHAWAAEQIALERLRGAFLVDGAALALSGPVRCALRLTGDQLSIDAQSADGRIVSFDATPSPQTDAAVIETARLALIDADKLTAKVAAFRALQREIPITHPFGDFGFTSVPARESVLFRGATVWTSAPEGILNQTDVLVRDGRIAAIGANLPVPPDARVIDCAGRHLSPGLIDCHSHTGIDGDVNEWTEACTAEVRIQDVIDPSDVGWYRALAGGLTCANQLHGSANPIGGQNSVVKLKWGSPLAEWAVPTATPGIKFALGENVVRPRGRYPQTRMGVEAFLRDRFSAAREYRQAQQDFAARGAAAGEMPLRIDLELETLAEILESKRIIHCHSYRQDEVLMLLRLADEFGFRIGTFQHILEGYKVADAIAAHGAGGSCFSDWWAYKMEVMDAIPWAGAMMQNQGVLMSFNSDSSELARHMNTEAAKAVKYGNLSPAKALAFVTINPARQLGVGDRTGSIEVGKDADLVLWSGDPLSPLTRCEQTWVEGTKRFDRADDLAARAGRELLRQRLVVAALGTKIDDPARDPPTVAPAPESPKAAPTRLLQRMVNSRDDYYRDLWRRGIDVRSLQRAGVCGCEEISQ